MSTENNLEINDLDNKTSLDKEVTVLTVQFSKNGTKHVTNINERPQVEPEYCRRCGGIENLFSLFQSSSYEGVVTIAQYGCECLWSYKMSIEERLERMGKLREGLERTFLFFNNLPDLEVERINREIKYVDEKILKDRIRLAQEQKGINPKTTKAYCPVTRRISEIGYCENMDG